VAPHPAQKDGVPDSTGLICHATLKGVGVFAAVDVHYLASGGARAALVLAEDAIFATIRRSTTALVNEVAPYKPGEFYLRELPALHAVLDDLDDVKNIELLLVDGYVDLDPSHRPGLRAHAYQEFNVPVIGVAKSRFLTATHAVPVLRGRSARPLFVTSAGVGLTEAADLIRSMYGEHRIPDALRLVDRLARGGHSLPGVVWR
jgi:deoxyribonuclease V